MNPKNYLSVQSSYLYLRSLVFSAIFCTILPLVHATDWIQYPSDGIATMTHYTIPSGFIAACGCTSDSLDYPTAAMSQMAYGSSTAYGPACGKCFNLTLLNTFLSDPPFFPDVVKSVVVKVTDLCPLSTTGWCNATTSGPNAGGSFLNFDLAFPSSAIPSDFFPSNASFYGYTDFGVWNISYQSVNCSNDWAGRSDASALGSVANEGTSVCCPANPTVRTCLDVATVSLSIGGGMCRTLIQYSICREVRTIHARHTRTQMVSRTSL
ncbi:uncharacterized protein STEHIDRAFT_67319 [Stereum hirsutum FP-91666 SS1]|uniref:uncharacterized protein n=1 Tax=Stereum hirsutum (strain FP-91666) TaxID=721885 RepID=UPI00044498C7|nr:uncharacterized protein STEHIDRAFT_67319 [Stereum hirsutum FP-91666 SS1]EIM81208.1 hypothetical protein STEHIDRAFT_67319 [Stereum hirsutum FP-91666 SS1]